MAQCQHGGYVAGSAAHIEFSFGHGFLDGAGAAEYAGDGVDAMLVHHMRIGAQAACNRNHWHPMLARYGGNAEWGFAKYGLLVDTAFARNDQAGTAHGLGQPHGLGNNFTAGAQLTAEESQHGSAHAASSTCTGHLVHINALVAQDDLGEALQVGIQRLHHLGSRTLLWAEDGRGAARACEWVVYVAGDFNRALRQACIQCTGVYAFQMCQGCTATANFLVCCVQQSHTQSLQHAGSTIVGSAAANSQNQVACARIQCGTNQLARAIAGGDFGVALRSGNQRQPAGCGHLDHGHMAVTS